MGGWSNRRLRRWTATGSCLTVTCAVLLGVSGAPGSPGPRRLGPIAPRTAVDTRAETSLRLLQMNLCDSGAAPCYTGRSVAEATAVIRDEGPDVVTLNEVCRDDVTALERTMAASGGAGTVVSAFQAAWDRRTGAALRCRNGQAYGIGLLTRLGSAPDGYRTTGGVYPMQDVRSPEERAWLCVSPATTAATAVAVCTTHLSSGSAAVARAQCGYLLDIAIPAVRARSRSVPVVLGGDLNLATGGSPDVRSCVPAGNRRVDDGVVQHVVATPEFAIDARRTIALRATDHPGLLVDLTLGARPAEVVAAGTGPAR